MSVEVKSESINVRERLAQILPKDTSPNFSSMPTVGNTPILESGSNANGNWIKYEDGTMVQWGLISREAIATTISLPSFGFRSGINSQTFPLEFTGDMPTILLTIGDVLKTPVVATYIPGNTLTLVTFYAMAITSGTYDFDAFWQAIGRWK